MILKDLILPNGATASCHVLIAATIKKPFDAVRMVVQSFASQAAYLAGAPYVLTDEYAMPASSAFWPLDAACEAWLMASANASPFAGGQGGVDTSMSLTTAQDRAWNRIKLARDAAEAADFTCDGHVYQADRERIMGAVLAAKLASDANIAFSADFTLSNNSTLTLNAQQMIAVGMTLLSNVEAVFARGRAKRIAIYSATSVSSLDEITWDSQ